MSTSGTTAYSTNRDKLIKRALRLIGAISQGETPTALQISEAATALNSLIKAWAADGMPLWQLLRKHFHLFLDRACILLVIQNHSKYYKHGTTIQPLM